MLGQWEEQPMPRKKLDIQIKHPGAFTAKAKKAGMTVAKYADYVMSHKDQFSASTVKQANFARNARKWR